MRFLIFALALATLPAFALEDLKYTAECTGQDITFFIIHHELRSQPPSEILALMGKAVRGTRGISSIKILPATTPGATPALRITLEKYPITEWQKPLALRDELSARIKNKLQKKHISASDQNAKACNLPRPY